MDKELRDMWIAALRSGNYKQGKRAYYNLDGTFCCLGVLCEILPKDVWFSDIISGIIFPNSILVRMNDKENKSFSEIADWIEEAL